MALSPLNDVIKLDAFCLVTLEMIIFWVDVTPWIHQMSRNFVVRCILKSSEQLSDVKRAEVSF